MATEVKVFILLLLYFVGCDFVAYLILKIKMPYWKKIGYNMDILFAMGIFTIITGLKVFTFFAYELIFILTFIGIIMHYFIPELCNFIGYIFSIPLKKVMKRKKLKSYYMKDMDILLY